MFEFLFGRKKQDAAQQGNQPAARAAAPGTHIAYSPELIDELKADHHHLLQIFGAIGAAHAAGDMAETASLLEQFRSVLGEHLLKENVRFYIYLEHALAGDPSSHALVHQFRREMDGIGKAVQSFLERYRHIASDPLLAGSFAADLAAVGKVLGQRIRSEEQTLYSLYMPAY